MPVEDAVQVRDPGVLPWASRNAAVRLPVNDSGVRSAAPAGSRRKDQRRGVAAAEIATLARARPARGPGREGRAASRAVQGRVADQGEIARAGPAVAFGGQKGGRGPEPRGRRRAGRGAGSRPGTSRRRAAGSPARWAVSKPASRRLDSTSGSSSAVCPARYWLTGSCSGTLSRAAWSGTGPDEKAEKVSFCVAKKATRGDGEHCPGEPRTHPAIPRSPPADQPGSRPAGSRALDQTSQSSGLRRPAAGPVAGAAADKGRAPAGAPWTSKQPGGLRGLALSGPVKNQLALAGS